MTVFICLLIYFFVGRQTGKKWKIIINSRGAKLEQPPSWPPMQVSGFVWSRREVKGRGGGDCRTCLERGGPGEALKGWEGNQDPGAAKAEGPGSSGAVGSFKGGQRGPGGASTGGSRRAIPKRGGGGGATAMVGEGYSLLAQPGSTDMPYLQTTAYFGVPLPAYSQHCRMSRQQFQQNFKQIREINKKSV